MGNTKHTSNANAEPKHSLTYDKDVKIANATFQTVFDAQRKAVQTAHDDQAAKKLIATNAIQTFKRENTKEKSAKTIQREETTENEKRNQRVVDRINSNADAELSVLLSNAE